MRINMSQSLQAILALAKTAFENADYKETIKQLKKAVSIKEDEISIYLNLSRVYQKLGNTQGVIKSLQRAVEIDTQPVSLFELAVAYLKTQNYEYAKKAVYKALSIESTNPSLYTLLGAVYKAEHSYDNALKCYKKAVKLDPKNTGLYDVLGNFYKERGQNALADKCFEIGKTFTHA